MSRPPRLTAGLWLVVFAALSCSSPAPVPAAIPGQTAAARRVLTIFEDRHLLGRPLDDGLLDRVSAQLAGSIGCEAGAARVRAARAQLGERLRSGDFDFVREAVSACGGAAGVDPEALTWDALARAHDPHSAYLSPRQQQAYQAEVDGTSSAARARGRIVDYAGERIALIELPSFYLRKDGASASADLRHLLTRLSADGPRVVLLDLRGNGGGVIEEALRVSAELVGPGTIGYVLARDRVPVALRANGQDPAWTGPLVVRVDATTASVSELVAAAIQDRGRGLILGARTYGKGTGQTLVLLSSPLGAATGAVRVTDRAFHRLDGRSLQLNGVEPDVTVSAGSAPEVTERERPNALLDPDIASPEPASSSPFSAAFKSRLHPTIAVTDEAVYAAALEYARALARD